MGWRVLVIRRRSDPFETVLAALMRAGIDADCERVDTESAMIDSLKREQWDLVIYDPESAKDISIELVYTYSAASPVVVMFNPSHMAEELARLVTSRDTPH